MKKIIHFHFDTKFNIGDEAVVLAIKDLLEKNIKISKYTSLKINYLTKINLYKNISEQYLISNPIIHRLKIDYIFIHLLIILIKINRVIRGTTDSKLISLINSHDLMIVGGGGVYSKWTIPFNTDLINRINIPIVIFGAGYNSNSLDKKISKEKLNSVKILNNKANLISVRDEKTLKFLKDLNSDSLLIGDPAIFLKSKKFNIKFKKEVKKIGLNIAGHELHVKKYTHETIKIYKRVIETLRRKYTIEVYYLKHTPNEKYISKKLKEAIPDITICEYGPQEMKYIYENLDLVISMLLHSSIFAYGSGVNFINIAYDVKNYSFMKLINNAENLIDLNNLNYNILYKKSIKLLKSKQLSNKIIKKSFFRRRINNFVRRIITLSTNN